MHFSLFTVSEVTMTALNAQEVDQLRIVDCSSNSNAESHIVGQSLILHCSVNIARSIDRLVNFTWSSNDTTVRMLDQTEETQDHYVISQLNTSNDGQMYKCEVVVNTSPPLIASNILVLNITGKPSLNICMPENKYTMYVTKPWKTGPIQEHAKEFIKGALNCE